MIKKIIKYITIKRRIHILLKAYREIETYNPKSKADYATLCIYAKAYNRLKEQLNNVF